MFRLANGDRLSKSKVRNGSNPVKGTAPDSGRAGWLSGVDSGPHFAFNLETSGGGAPASFVDRCNNSFDIGVGVGGNTSQPSVTIDVR